MYQRVVNLLLLVFFFSVMFMNVFYRYNTFHRKCFLYMIYDIFQYRINGYEHYKIIITK